MRGLHRLGSQPAAAGVAARRDRLPRSSRHGMPVGRDDRSATRRPAEEMAVRTLCAVRDHAVEARLAVRAVAPPRCARAIDADHGVMDGVGRAWAGTRRRGRNGPRRSASGKHQVAEDVVITGAQRIRARRGDDEIRRAELPAVGKVGVAGRSRGSPSTAALGDPALDRRELSRRSGGARRRTRASPGSGSHGGMCRSRVCVRNFVAVRRARRRR